MSVTKQSVSRWGFLLSIGVAAFVVTTSSAFAGQYRLPYKSGCAAPTHDACYRCPQGYKSSGPGLSSVHGDVIRRGSSCSKLIRTKAKFHKRLRSKCPRGSFYDGYNGGTCWACPRGYPRSIHHIKSAKACAKPRGLFKGYAHKRAIYKGKIERKCPGGTFKDPRNGGECWSCPSGYKRTVFAVTTNNACEKTAKARVCAYATPKRSGIVSQTSWNDRCRPGQ